MEFGLWTIFACTLGIYAFQKKPLKRCMQHHIVVGLMYIIIFAVQSTMFILEDETMEGQSLKETKLKGKERNKVNIQFHVIYNLLQKRHRVASNGLNAFFVQKITKCPVVYKRLHYPVFNIHFIILKTVHEINIHT